jgi:hypothetical protein
MLDASPSPELPPSRYRDVELLQFPDSGTAFDTAALA